MRNSCRVICFYQVFLGIVRIRLLSKSLDYRSLMGLILGCREKEKRSNLLVSNLLERLFCGERGSRTYAFKKYHKIANH